MAEKKAFPERNRLAAQQIRASAADAAALGMTEEELRKAREASLEAMDMEMAMEIAPYFNYSGPIDISKARYHGFPNIPMDVNLTLGGFRVEPNDPERPFTKEQLEPYKGRIRGQEFEVPVEPGTVNVLHNKGKNVWAHEYRHDRYPGVSENMIRLMDAATATNEKDWKKAVRMWRDKFRRKGENITMEQAEVELAKDIKSDAGKSFGYIRSMFEDEFEEGATVPGVDYGFFEFNDKGQYTKGRGEMTYGIRKAEEVLMREELKERGKDRD